MSTLTFELREGVTLRATRNVLFGTRHVLTLSAAEKASVTNWNNAEVWLIANGTQAVRVTRVRGYPIAGQVETMTAANMPGQGSLVASLEVVPKTPSKLTVEIGKAGSLIATRLLEPGTSAGGLSTRWELLLTDAEKTALGNFTSVQVWLIALEGNARAP